MKKPAEAGFFIPLLGVEEGLGEELVIRPRAPVGPSSTSRRGVTDAQN
jgi:hypothetical protein